MIRDILSQAVDSLDRCLNDPLWNQICELAERIIRLRDEAKDVLLLLDAHPHETLPTERITADGFTEKETGDINDRQHPVPGNSQDVRSKRRKYIDWMMSDDSAHDMGTPFFSKKDLLKRGWSRRLIEQILGPPDWKSENPHFAGAAPMLCWRRDRVREAEDTPAFQESFRKI
jgi:hypothetical protein